MKKIFIKIVSFLFMVGALSSSAIAIDKLHFVVPGGAGGGWDGCARGTGEAIRHKSFIFHIFSVFM